MDRDAIRLGSHRERYGNWMSKPVFYIVGGGILLTALLTVLFFAVFRLIIPGIVTAALLLLLTAAVCWLFWIRGQYSFSGGGVMERTHRVLLSYLDYDGKGELLDVGCGSGALTILAALRWPGCRATGIDSWGAAWEYSKEGCESNAASEGVADRCVFRRGDACRLDLPDESFDAVVSNYVYHNVMGVPDKKALLRESLRVLKKGGVFALQDDMKPGLYRDMEGFVRELKEEGFQDVRLIDTAAEIFGTGSRAKALMLGHSKALVGRK